MKVHVLAKREFDKLMDSYGITDENVEKFDNIMFISIVDSEQWSDSRIPHFKENHNNVINLAFDDAEHDGGYAPILKEDDETQAPSSFTTRAFSKEQATQLFEFIKVNKEKEICIVHCMAGISRSAAVGTFVNGYCGGDWDRFKKENPHISPNGRVHRMLNEAKYNDLDESKEN